MSDMAHVRLREATLEDQPAVDQLLGRLGLQLPTEPEHARDRWQWLWRDNPAVSSASNGRIGWALESGRDVVGFFGTVPRRYVLRSETLAVAVASQWAVEASFRARTPDLVREYFGQADVQLLMVTTAIRPVARIFERAGGAPLPQPYYRQVLYWVLDAGAFVRAALRKKGLAAPLEAVTRTLGPPILAAAVAAGRRRPGKLRASLEPEQIALQSVGAEFTDLWHRKKAEGQRLYAYRTDADIRWHFQRWDDRGRLSVLQCRRAGRLHGYLVLIREDTHGIGLTRARVADLFVAGDDDEVIDALFAAAYERAVEQGCHVLEVVGLPRHIRSRLERSKPFTRSYDSFPFHYKALTPGIAELCREEDAWYAGPYDGDTTLE